MKRLKYMYLHYLRSKIIGKITRGLINKNSKAGFIKADHRLELDMSMPHEREYMLREIFKLRYPQSDLDRLIFQRFVRPGDAVLDVGANIGMTALQALEAGAGTVACMEPVPALYGRLEALRAQRQVSSAGNAVQSPLTVFNHALSDHEGIVPMFLSVQHNQGNTIDSGALERHRAVFGASAPQSIDVHCSTVDILFGDQRFDVWKIDAEGAEMKILDGARSTLAEHPPRVVIAEIDQDVPLFWQKLGPAYVDARRCLVTRNRYELELAKIDVGPNVRKYYNTASMYVFSTEAF